MKKILTGLLVLILLGGIVAYNLFFARISVDGERFLCIDADDTADSAMAKLDGLDAGYSHLGFDILSGLTGYAGHVRPGRYAVSRDLSTLQLVRNLRSHRSVPVRLVVPAVRTLENLAGRLSRLIMPDSAALIRCFTSDSVLQSLGLTRATVVTIFIPDTYEVYWEITPQQLVSRMQREHEVFWNADRIAKASDAGLSPEEVYTLASIVDSETAANAEKARIAGLYINRLNRGMPLQSDPTVIFATGDFSIRRVTGKHLAIDSPYNTYRVRGLPPGPIRVASVAGIDAVLNYEHNDYLYMCAKEDFSGTHNFAAGIQEHYANARRYAAALNARGIR